MWKVAQLIFFSTFCFYFRHATSAAFDYFSYLNVFSCWCTLSSVVRLSHRAAIDSRAHVTHTTSDWNFPNNVASSASSFPFSLESQNSLTTCTSPVERNIPIRFITYCKEQKVVTSPEMQPLSERC